MLPPIAPYASVRAMITKSRSSRSRSAIAARYLPRASSRDTMVLPAMWPQRFPKRCGHIAGKTIVSREEALGKYRAAIAERDRLDRDFVIIARTDAYGAIGGSMDEAIWRDRAYADAGVDLVWAELSNSERDPAIEFARAMRQTHPKLPLAFNYSSS